MDLPRNKDGNYIDLAATIICNNCKTRRERDKKLQEYYDKIRSIYPVDTFEIEAEDGRKLNFYREHFLLNLIEDDADINVDSLDYNLYEKEWGDCDSEIAHISINKKSKNFHIAVWDNEKYEGKGYAKEIYRNAGRILEILGIKDIELYEITTPVDKATEHMKEKYGTLKNNFQDGER